MAKAKPPSPFTGRWRIVSMSAWDEDYLDEEEPAYIEFDDRNGGEFHFGYAHGSMDCRLGTRDGNPTSNGPGMATTRWTRRKAEAGRR